VTAAAIAETFRCERCERWETPAAAADDDWLLCQVTRGPDANNVYAVIGRGICPACVRDGDFQNWSSVRQYAAYLGEAAA
jgi:hypothetical protein